MTVVAMKPLEAIKESGLNLDEAMSFFNGGASVTREAWGVDEYLSINRELDNSVQVFKRKDGVITEYKLAKKDEKATDWKLFIKQPIEDIEYVSKI